MSGYPRLKLRTILENCSRCDARVEGTQNDSLDRSLAHREEEQDEFHIETDQVLVHASEIRQGRASYLNARF